MIQFVSPIWILLLDVHWPMKITPLLIRAKGYNCNLTLIQFPKSDTWKSLQFLQVNPRPSLISLQQNRRSNQHDVQQQWWNPWSGSHCNHCRNSPLIEKLPASDNQSRGEIQDLTTYVPITAAWNILRAASSVPLLAKFDTLNVYMHLLLKSPHIFLSPTFAHQMCLMK